MEALESPAVPASPVLAERRAELTILLAAVAMATMATAIASVAAPAVHARLHLSGAALELMASGYVLAYAVLLMIGARLGDYGHRKLLLVGLVVFTVAAAVSGLAPNGGVLIAGQILEGTGAALMVPQVLSLIQLRFDGPARSRALALYALVLAVGVAGAQVLGGLLVTINLFGLGWRAVFLIDIPFGILLLIAAGLTLPPDPVDVRRPFDVPGALVFSIALLAIVVPLALGNTEHWPTWTWVGLAVGAAGLAAFVWLQRATVHRGGQPLADLRALSPTATKSGLLVVFIVMGGYGALLFTISLHLQQGYGYSPLHSGLVFATYAVGFAASNLSWSRLPQRLHRFIPLCGLAILAAAEALLSVFVHSGWTYATAGPMLFLAGVGHGASFGAAVALIVARSQPAHVSTLSGLITTVAQLAIFTGLAVLGGRY